MKAAPLILIVEDNAGSLMLATVMLETEGFHVVGAESAEAARDMLTLHTPDLILMDIQLPGMDGLEFTKELKSKPSTSTIPVVALTAHTRPLHKNAAMAAGCDGFIAKPWTPEGLSRQIRTFLSGPGAENE